MRSQLKKHYLGITFIHLVTFFGQRRNILNMIYSTPKELFPELNNAIESHSFFDENSFEWKIARVQNGFFVAYFGDDYFKESYFDLSGLIIKNTGCFFVQDTSFDAYYHFREILQSGYTDDIWESIEELLTERFLHSPDILECERRD